MAETVRMEELSGRARGASPHMQQEYSGDALQCWPLNEGGRSDVLGLAPTTRTSVKVSASSVTG